MGDYRITIDGIGAHGCDRVAQPDSGGTIRLNPCNQIGCVDCLARTFARLLGDVTGGRVTKATLEHWPKRMLVVYTTEKEPDYAERVDSAVGPTDNLLTRTRDKPF